MLLILGILIIIASVGFFIYGKYDYNEYLSEKNRNIARYERQQTPYPEYSPIMFSEGKHLFGGLVLGLFLSISSGLFFMAQPGTAYSVQYPWGRDVMVENQGPKLKFWGNVIPISYEISVKDIISSKELDKFDDFGDGIYNRLAKKWEFSDAIKADIATSVIVGIDVSDVESFLNMADKNRSEMKLVYGRVLPNIDASLKNTCKLMDAQDYISGKSSDFDRYFRDQLENGMYLVEEYYEQEQMGEIIGDTSTIRHIQPSKSSKAKKYKIKTDSQGNIMRDTTSNSLKQYGLKIFQAQVTGIDWEESFDLRLDKQKDEVAKTQLEKQEAERQFYTAKKEIAKGEAEKASERAKLEKEQIKLTIAAETQAKVAEQNVIVEKRQLEVEKLKAQSKKVAADATYYENSKLVSAGLTPQERAEFEKGVAIGVAAEIAKIKFPETMIIGGDKGGTPLESLIGAAMAKQLTDKKTLK